MKKGRSYLKKLQAVSCGCAAIVGIVGMISMPVSGKESDKKYYRVMAQGETIGVFDSEAEASDIVVEARKQAAGNEGENFLSRLFCSVETTDQKEKNSDREQSIEQLTTLMKREAVNDESMTSACTLKIGDELITLAGKEEVLAVLDGVKNKYDTKSEYECRLLASEKQPENSLTVSVVRKADVATSDVLGISFAQSVEIMPVLADKKEIKPVADAILTLTKEQECRTTHTVQPGECLSLIAQEYGMKTAQLKELNQLSDSDSIGQGDELLIMVPEPVLSVVVQKKAAYTERYNAKTVYKDNDSWYTSKQVVLNEGTEGIHDVVATVTYCNDKEQNREIIQETVIQESSARVIERGTQVPPTYVKPLAGGRFSSPFGKRWGRMHKGVDWSCSVGTAIKASCGGRVVSAGWQNGYGNCVVLSHSDGKQTKYAHLSKILVSVGAKVAQGDKIALSGNTGNSTGPHLHFEILVNGTQVNPMKYLK